MRRTSPPAVVHVVSNISVGGISSLLRAVLPKMSGEFSVTVCSIGGTELADAFAELGLDVVGCPVPSRVGPAGQWRLARLFRRKRVRIVHTHGYVAGISATLAARLAGVEAVISHVHDMRVCKCGRQRLQERLASRFRECTVFVSHAAKRSYLRGVSSAGFKRAVVHNGVDAPDDAVLARRGELRRSLGISEEAKVVVGVGRLVASKRLDVFLEVCASVMRVVRDVIAVIIGDGPERPRLERKAEELGISDGMVFTGTRREIYGFLGLGDVFVSTSEAEGFGLTVLEAMRAGVPAVSSQLESIQEFAGDDGAVALVPVGDRDAFARSVIDILRDPDRAGRMAASARLRARSFSAEACARRLRDIYRTLLSRATNGRTPRSART